MGIQATNNVDGSARYDQVGIRATSGGSNYSDTVSVRAGETTIYVINDLEYTDSDNDLLSDALENRLIDMDPNDAYASHDDIGPNTDFDGDGLTEWAELVLGTSSMDADNNVIRPRMEDGFLILQHPESRTNTGLEVFAQKSESLRGWAPEGITRQVMDTTSTHRVVEWSVPQQGDRGFMQLFIRRAP